MSYQRVGTVARSNSSTDELYAALGLVTAVSLPIFTNGSVSPSSGSLKCMPVWLSEGATITTLGVVAFAAGVGMTHGIFGVYDSALNLVAQSADTPAAFETTGPIWVDLTAPFTAPSSGVYYLGLLSATNTTNVTVNALPAANGLRSLPLIAGRAYSTIFNSGPLAALPDPVVNNGNANSALWIGAR